MKFARVITDICKIHINMRCWVEVFVYPKPRKLSSAFPIKQEMSDDGEGLTFQL